MYEYLGRRRVIPWTGFSEELGLLIQVEPGLLHHSGQEYNCSESLFDLCHKSPACIRDNDQIMTRPGRIVDSY